ncbi:MAG: DHA2 family efflux MFS transporter permease subunit [Smithellaceae bacterium]|jgi:DHA2 family multidrug resistance protein
MDESHGPHKWLITLTVMTGSIMSSLDISIVNVALPHMRGTLGASVEEITWVSTGYILSNVIIMPIVAFLSSRFGRKNFYIFSVLLFTASSMLCGIAWDLTSMVVFRIMQGIGAGALIPVSQSVLRETFPPKEQAMAMGIFGVGVMLGPAIGPTLGGWLTDNYSWPWIFYINVPIGIINVLLIMKFIEDPYYLVRQTGKVDVLGLSLMMVGLGALQTMLEEGELNDWFSSNFIIYLSLVASFGLILFIWRELKVENPVVNLRILKDINFSSATFLSGILGLALMSSLFILPLFLQQLLGYPAFDSGLALIPRSVAMLMIMPLAGRIYNRVGPRLMIGIGLFLNAVSFYQLSILSLSIGIWDIFLPQFLQGVAFGLIFVSLSTAALSTIEKQMLTAAAGLYNVVRQVFSSVGIALATTILTHGEQANRALLMEHITAFGNTSAETLRSLSQYFSSQGMDIIDAQNKALKAIEGIVMRQASMISFNHVFFLIAVIFVISTPLIFLINDSRRELKTEIINE